MHTLDLIREHEGLEEWHCKACGRRLLVNWSPKFKRTVVHEGDLEAGHSGVKEELPQGNTDGVPGKTEAGIQVDESRLTPWSVWMGQSGFADLWDDNVQ